MSELNNSTIVKEQYANAGNLNTRISIHDKYSTNKTGFGNWIMSNYKIETGMKILELGCGTGDMWNFTLQNGREHLGRVFRRIEKLEYEDSLRVTNIDDLIEYIYSLSDMTSLGALPREDVRKILVQNMRNGVLEVPKDYGMFVAN